MYTNIIDQISESDVELKKCLNCFHIDYFIYKSNLINFVNLFELITSSTEKLNEFLNDRRISRAYEACLLLMGDKIANTQNSGLEANADALKKLKKSLASLADYLAENFQTILETENGIFALRAFLRIIGEPDDLEVAANAVNDQRSAKRFKNEFNVKNLPVKLVPTEWKLNKYLKKFSKFLSDINVLGKKRKIAQEKKRNKKIFNFILKKLV